MKHTPGPWHFTDFDGYLSVKEGPNRDKFWGILDDDHPNSEANRRLAAAAPDLLEALQLLVDAQSLKGSLIHAIDNALTAIKKATE